LQRQVLVYMGNVVIAQGSMQLRAERVEMRQTSDGHRTALALGTSNAPATWRQKREGFDETVEGSADRIEFDGKADTLRLLGKSVVRRLRGAVVADEISGADIVWDNNAEVFRVEGGTASPSNPSGRVRAVLSPRTEPAGAAGAATKPAPSATNPASSNPAPNPAPVPTPALTPSRSLGDRR
jgi:lipopolysaccharide export system protein LptA